MSNVVPLASKRAYRILVTGAPDWDDPQEVRLALIAATVSRPGAVIVIDQASPAIAAAAAEWASDYDVRTEEHAEDGRPADRCLTFARPGAT